MATWYGGPPCRASALKMATRSASRLMVIRRVGNLALVTSATCRAARQPRRRETSSGRASEVALGRLRLMQLSLLSIRATCADDPDDWPPLLHALGRPDYEQRAAEAGSDPQPAPFLSRVVLVAALDRQRIEPRSRCLLEGDAVPLDVGS